MPNRRLVKEIVILSRFQEILKDSEETIMKGEAYKKNRTQLILLNINYKLDDIIFLDHNPNRVHFEIYVGKEVYDIKITTYNYPFNMPYLYINDNEYEPCMNAAKMASLGQIPICRCDSSIICRNNWRPTYTFLDIIKEIIEYQQLITRLKEKYYMKMYICWKRLGFYLPLSHYL